VGAGRPRRPAALAGAHRLALLAAMLCGAALAEAAPADPADARPYDRPDAQSIRDEAREVLGDARFRKRASLMDAIRRWLSDLLRGLDAGLPGGMATVARVLFWLLLGGCAAVMVAVVVLLTRMLIGVVRQGRGARMDLLRAGPVHFAESVTYEQLAARIAELVRSGAFREAVGLMMAALVLWLERGELLRFHPSKTNGEYVREYPPQRPGRGEFRQFAVALDAVTYGSGRCDGDDYRRVARLFQQVCHHAQGQAV
jgi:hypothetical protein